MLNVIEIMDMLDWHKPPEVQSKGIFLAKDMKTIVPFLQPLTPRHNKNVWENCALIVAEKDDEQLKPHLVELLEWLQDMNWPGAFCILTRLKEYSDSTSIQTAINICTKKAKDCNDIVWESNLNILIQND